MQLDLPRSADFGLILVELPFLMVKGCPHLPLVGDATVLCYQRWLPWSPRWRGKTSRGFPVSRCWWSPLLPWPMWGEVGGTLVGASATRALHWRSHHHPSLLEKCSLSEICVFPIFLFSIYFIIIIFHYSYWRETNLFLFAGLHWRRCNFLFFLFYVYFFPSNFHSSY